MSLSLKARYLKVKAEEYRALPFGVGCMGIYRRQGVWYVDLAARLSPTGERYRRAIGGDRRQAEEYEAKLTMEVRERRLFANSKGFEHTWSQLFFLMIDEYSYTHHKKQTRRRHRVSYESLVKVFGSLPVAVISPSDIERYKAQRKKEMRSPYTINRELECLRLTLSMAVRWSWIKENPFKNVRLLEEPEGRTRWYTFDEFHRLLSVMPRYMQDLCTFAAFTGMRMNEILFLQYSQLNLQEKRLALLGTQTKNKRSRIVALNQTAVDVIRSQIHRVGVPYVFYNPENGKPWAPVSHTFAKFSKIANVPDARFHDLRHTFCSWMVMSGKDLNTVRDLVGHQSLRMTIRYSHLLHEVKVQAVEVLDKISEKKLF